MGVRQIFHWEWPPGVEPIWFKDWIFTLSEPEQEECLAGMRHQHEMRQQAINDGRMVMRQDEYVWKDAETAEQGKGIDDVWEKYWLRWQKETGVKWSQTFEEE